MDPPPSLSFPQNPIPYQPLPHNPSPNFFFQLPPHNPNQYSSAPPPPVRELSGTLSSLKSLISHCERTLNSLSQTLPSDSLYVLRKGKNDGFVRCPFNPNHLMPPEALFLHSLRCPPPLDLTHLLGSFSNYRNTLEVPELPLNRSDGDLCIYLDDFADFGSSFFYKDCPGVVNLSELDRRKIILTIPSVLSVERSGSVGYNEKEKKGTSEKRFRLLPSDLWAIRNEVNAWRDYPSSYSSSVLYAILDLKMVAKSDVRKWILVNSPIYGVIIDTCMRDHIFMLLLLCLKAIVKEARALVEFDANSEDLKGNQHVSSLKSRGLECTVLVQVLTWFASQLAVLYGEGNAKFFALDMFKQCIVESASPLMMFQSEGTIMVNPKPESCGVYAVSDDANSNSKDVKPDEPFENTSRVKGESLVDDQVIYVSRVAAAVAALHERSLLEGKLRAIRFTQTPTRYQRIVEHAAMTAKADEERNKRPSYRPIIDHDGLPRQRLSNHEMNKMKTKEELMAEERDYKRRRMSYRGKKVKRTPLQVLRDIIEEYTEEIRQAGGIGCFEKGPEKGMALTSPSSTGNDRTEIDFDYNTASTLTDASPRFYKQTRGDNRADSTENWISSDKDKRYKDYDYGSSQRQHSHGNYRSHDRGDHRDEEFTRLKHRRIQRETHHHHAKGYSDYKRKRDDPYDHHSRRAEKQNAFGDRYNPSE